MVRLIASLLLTLILVWFETMFFHELNGHPKPVYVRSVYAIGFSFLALWVALHLLFFNKDYDELE